MTVEVNFITDCLVCMVLSFYGLVYVLVFPACSCFAGSCAKALSRPQTRHGCAVFSIASGRAVKNPWPLEFAASSSPDDNALCTR
jgi:hypothetical protein